ncbi:hypothetical protein TNCV_31301 [Trichonephila clavipes]|nr:hypothetical protein TNCV_31301 [Trichonephila clavipes]
MGRSDAAIRRCWQEWVDRDRFQRIDGSGRPRCLAKSVQMCSDNHRRRVWRRPGLRADLAFPIARHRGP